MAALIVLFSNKEVDLVWDDRNGAFDVIVDHFLACERRNSELVSYLEEYKYNYYLDFDNFPVDALINFRQNVYHLFCQVDIGSVEGMNRRYMLISLGHLLKLAQRALRFRNVALFPPLTESDEVKENP